jgi:glycosyltransferase involved in cell wall biosynthesis
VHLYHLAAPITRYADAAFFFNYWRTKRLLRKINPEIVSGLGLSNYGFYAALCGKHPLVVGAYGSDVLRAPKESRRLKWMVRYAIRSADLVTADAKVLKNAIVELGGVDEKVIVFPLGVDKSLLSMNSSRHFVPKKEFTVLSYRSLEPVYNIQQILSSFALLSNRMDGVKLLIAGDGSQRRSLENLCSQIGIEERTRFIGAVFHHDVPKLLEAADVYVSTSISDSTSVSLLEAMAAGVYPIVSDIPGNKEWIEDGVNGSVVPISDPLTLADKIAQALRSDELRKTAAKNNLELITKRALWDDNVGFLEAALKRLANG